MITQNYSTQQWNDKSKIHERDRHALDSGHVSDYGANWGLLAAITYDLVRNVENREATGYTISELYCGYCGST